MTNTRFCHNLVMTHECLQLVCPVNLCVPPTPSFLLSSPLVFRFQAGFGGPHGASVGGEDAAATASTVGGCAVDDLDMHVLPVLELSELSQGQLASFLCQV